MNTDQILTAIATALDNIARGQATTQDEAIAACVQQIKLILSSKEI